MPWFYLVRTLVGHEAAILLFFFLEMLQLGKYNLNHHVICRFFLIPHEYGSDSHIRFLHGKYMVKICEIAQSKQAQTIAHRHELVSLKHHEQHKPYAGKPNPVPCSRHAQTTPWSSARESRASSLSVSGNARSDADVSHRSDGDSIAPATSRKASRTMPHSIRAIASVRMHYAHCRQGWAIARSAAAATGRNAAWWSCTGKKNRPAPAMYLHSSSTPAPRILPPSSHVPRTIPVPS